MSSHQIRQQSKIHHQGVFSRPSCGLFWLAKLLNALPISDFEPSWSCTLPTPFSCQRRQRSHSLHTFPVWPTFLPLLVLYWQMEVGGDIEQSLALGPSISLASPFSLLEPSFIPATSLDHQSRNCPSRNYFKSGPQPFWVFFSFV